MLNYIKCNFVNCLYTVWFGSSLYYLLLLPFSWLYGLFSILNRISYQYGWRKVHKFPVPIIMVGNLTIGGNGKTPVVLWLVEQLKCRGWKVGVVSRGYKGKSKNYPIIVNENTSSSKCGDEPFLIWRRTKVLVAVSPKRVDAVSELLRLQSLDVIISDDGLQHYALFRDVEWVVVNSVFRFGNGCWLPAGPMRERIVRLNEVQAVIINSLTNTKIESGEISMQLYPNAIINLLTKERKSLNFLDKVVAIAGIGHPNQFFDILNQYGIFPIRTISFTDHYMYSLKKLMSLTKIDESLLMTEKDAIKCLNFAQKNWWYVHIDIRFNQVDSDKLLSIVEKKINLYKFL